MARKYTVLWALTLVVAALLIWFSVSRQAAYAQAPQNTANAPAFPATVGTATTAASDGQGSVVITYPNGIIAVVKPSSLGEGPGKPLSPPQSAIGIYRIQANGLVERLSLPGALR